MARGTNIIRTHKAGYQSEVSYCVRFRLLYSVPTWELTEYKLSKVESILHGFLRKMVQGGFEWMNALSRTERILTQKVKGDLDWNFKISNKQLHYTIDTLLICDLCYLQHLKYVGHACSLDCENSCGNGNSYKKWKSWPLDRLDQRVE